MDAYRQPAAVPDVVRVRHMEVGDRIPGVGAKLMRWMSPDITDDEARELARRGPHVSTHPRSLMRLIGRELPSMRRKPVEVHELSLHETPAVPKVTAPTFGLFDA